MIKQRINAITFAGLNVVKGIGLNRALETTCRVLRVDVNDVKSKTRLKDVVYARHIFCFIAYTLKNSYSLKKIGHEINRDHASVLHGKNRISNQYDIYKPVFDDVEEIKRQLLLFKGDYDNSKITKEHVGHYITNMRRQELKKWCDKKDAVSVNKLK